MKNMIDAHKDAVSVFVRVHPISECIGGELKKQCAQVARNLKKYVGGNFKEPKKLQYNIMITNLATGIFFIQRRMHPMIGSLSVMTN